MFKPSNSAIFPIDGELLGNEGNSHTYHFSYELAGTLSFSAADTFTLGGDDDLGRVTVTWQWTWAVFTGTDLIGPELSEGTNHSFGIFFAERHTVASRFAITTTLGLTTPSPIPVPAGLPLLQSGIAAFGFPRKRRAA